MRKLRFILFLLLLSASAMAQELSDKLAQSWQQFIQDTQLRAAIASIYIVEARSGKPIFARNESIGLAPASTQKVITAATSYELLGKEFRYSTKLACDSALYSGNSNGDLYLLGSGDPTLGSWRWPATSPDSILNQFARAAAGQIHGAYRDLVFPQRNWSSEIIPAGWIWEDLGQYYGAGAQVLNWHENQFDLKLRSGDYIGDSVLIVGSTPKIADSIAVEARSAAAGTGDQTYLFPANNGRPLTLRGTIPVSQQGFKVSGSIPDPQLTLATAFNAAFLKAGIKRNGIIIRDKKKYSSITLAEHQSPPLDSIIFWFLRKSINLYGEALIKTMAAAETRQQVEDGAMTSYKQMAETAKGVERLRAFWKERGIDPVELRLRDGSGLSPENRVSTRAQVQVLQYARRQGWFSGYYLAFPEYNGMKMKSGTIGGVKAYCGYHISKEGKSYTFSFIVNNYNGSEGALVQKMYALLNELK